MTDAEARAHLGKRVMCCGERWTVSMAWFREGKRTYTLIQRKRPVHMMTVTADRIEPIPPRVRAKKGEA